MGGTKATSPHCEHRYAADRSPLSMSRSRLPSGAVHQRCCHESPNRRKPGSVPRILISPSCIAVSQRGHLAESLTPRTVRVGATADADRQFCGVVATWVAMGSGGIKKHRRTRSDDAELAAAQVDPFHQEHNIWTVEGQIEQHGHAARALKFGLRSPRWRRFLLLLVVGAWMLLTIGALLLNAFD